MNEKVNKFLLIVDEFMPEMHLRQSGLVDLLFVAHLQETRKEIKILKEQEIHDIFIKKN